MAFLLQELELTSTAKEISTLVSKELTPIVEGLQSNLREKSEEVMTKLHENMIEMIAQTKTSIKEIGKVTDKMVSTAERENMAISYWDALNQGIMGLPVQVDPRVRAKESIRARQFLWTLSEETQELKSLPAPQLLKQLNRKLAKAAKTTNEECKLRSAMWLKNGRLLIKASNSKLAAWLHSKANIFHMECKLGTTILTKSCNYNTMAYFIPLTFSATEKSYIEEITEANDLPNGSISKCRWAKAPE